MPRSATLELESTGPRAPTCRDRAHGPGINVGIAERFVSTIAGGVLVTWGSRRRSPLRILGALAGTDLIYRGVSGHCSLYSAMGFNTAGARKPGSQIRADAPEVRRSFIIGRSARELYEFWRDPNNLARITAHSRM